MGRALVGLCAMALLVACSGDASRTDPIEQSETSIDDTVAEIAAPEDTRREEDASPLLDAVVDADPTPPFEHFDINHVLGTGQSLSVGAVGSPPLSTMQPYANIMFAKGPIAGGTGLDAFAPLVERTVETHSSGMANAAAKIARVAFMGLPAPRNDHVILVSQHGVGGTAYAGLKKGTTPYANGLAQVKAALALATAGKKTYVVRVLTNVHGESDHVAKNANYDKDLAQWQADYEADVRKITGQTLPIPMLHTQMSAFTKYGQATSPIPQMQLVASRTSGGKLVMVGPKYTMAYVSDGVHLSNVGYRVMGEYYAKAYERIVLERKPWVPLQPKTITRDGLVLTLELDVPVPPLVLDTTLVSDPGSFGFEVVDDGKAAKIASVTIASPTSVKITLAAMPTGKAMRLRYAFTGTAGANAGPKTGARGNLRDSDPKAATDGTKLYNWCVHFDEPVP